MWKAQLKRTTAGDLGSEARFSGQKKCLFLVPWKISMMSI